MINNYRCFNISCDAGKNIVTEIYKVLKQEGNIINNFKLKFIGFETTPLTNFKLNKKNMTVPSSGQFISPFDGDEYLNIEYLVFDEQIDDMVFYCIY